MPPSHICASVCSTSSKNRTSPRRMPVRHSTSSIEHCGNFGARPSPPLTGSNARAMAFAVASSSRAPITTWLAGRDLFASARHQGIAIVLDALRLLAKQPGDLLHHVDEAGPAIARHFGKVGAAPHRFAVGGQEHGERPAALLAQVMQRGHVDLVDVRPLLAVDLYVDEEIVHDRRGRRVLEAFMGHDMAPVAGRIADREQDRLVALLRGVESVGSPRPPVHGIVPVLQQIGTGLEGQTIFVRRGS